VSPRRCCRCRSANGSCTALPLHHTHSLTPSPSIDCVPHAACVCLCVYGVVFWCGFFHPASNTVVEHTFPAQSLVPWGTGVPTNAVFGYSAVSDTILLVSAEVESDAALTTTYELDLGAFACTLCLCRVWSMMGLGVCCGRNSLGAVLCRLHHPNLFCLFCFFCFVFGFVFVCDTASCRHEDVVRH